MQKVWFGLMILVMSVSVQAQKGTVSVAGFGAATDGKADSTGGFNKALAAGRDVYVPPGRYRVTDLKLPEETFFHGAGAASVIILARGEGSRWSCQPVPDQRPFVYRRGGIQGPER